MIVATVFGVFNTLYPVHFGPDGDENPPAVSVATKPLIQLNTNVLDPNWLDRPLLKLARLSDGPHLVFAAAYSNLETDFSVRAGGYKGVAFSITDVTLDSTALLSGLLELHHIFSQYLEKWRHIGGNLHEFRRFESANIRVILSELTRHTRSQSTQLWPQIAGRGEVLIDCSSNGPVNEVSCTDAVLQSDMLSRYHSVFITSDREIIGKIVAGQRLQVLPASDLERLVRSTPEPAEQPTQGVPPRPAAIITAPVATMSDDTAILEDMERRIANLDRSLSAASQGISQIAVAIASSQKNARQDFYFLIGMITANILVLLLGLIFLVSRSGDVEQAARLAAQRMEESVANHVESLVNRQPATRSTEPLVQPNANPMSDPRRAGAPK